MEKVMFKRVISILLIALAACAAQDKPTAESVNAALAQLDAYIGSSMATTKVPGGSGAVIFNDKVIFLRGYGVRKVGAEAAVDADAVFEIASFSKPIASSVVASLVGEK